MTDGIGRIFGGNNWGNYTGLNPQQKGEEADNNTPAPNNYAETQVDPEKIMEFLASNNYFIAPAQETSSSGEVDPALQARVEGYMENFEMIYGVIVDEFGEELAPLVMDFVMDYLMGMAA